MEKSPLSWVLAHNDQIIQLSKNFRFIQPTWYIVSNSCTHGHNYFQQSSMLTSWIFRLIQSTFIIVSNSLTIGHNCFQQFFMPVFKDRCESEASELSLLHLHHVIYYNKVFFGWSLIKNQSSQFQFWELFLPVLQLMNSQALSSLQWEFDKAIAWILGFK